MSVDNKTLFNTVVNDMPKETAERIATLSSDLPSVFSVMNDYPTVKNDFINTLVNKVGKSMIFSKIYSNPLKMLKKGKLEYGESIEQIFVQMAQMKGFNEHWADDSQTPEADLIRKLEPKVTALYISRNYDKKFKTTVTDKQLRKAFFNEFGLSNLIQQIVGAITTSIEFHEFKYTRDILNYLVGEAKSLTMNEDSTDSYDPIKIGKSAPIKQTPYCVSVGDTTSAEGLRKLAQSVKETVGKMKFMSDKFNLAKEKTFTNPKELVLITTPEISSGMDVYVLANAFNVSQTELNTRVIEVDEMPKGIFKGTSALVDKAPNSLEAESSVTCDETKKPKAILVDADLLQIYDTHLGNGTFYNPEQQATNFFGNREGIFATCLFANMAVFY